MKVREKAPEIIPEASKSDKSTQNCQKRRYGKGEGGRERWVVRVFHPFLIWLTLNEWEIIAFIRGKQTYVEAVLDLRVNYTKTN